MTTTPAMIAVNNEDGTGTATVSGSDVGSTNTLYKLPKWGAAFAWSSIGSRTGDGTIPISGVGDYVLLVISDDGASYSFPTNPVSISITNGRRTCIRDSAAQAEYQAAKLSEYGLQVAWQNGENAAAVNVWCTIENASVLTQLRDTSLTDTEDVIFHIPRQTGFPPAQFLPGGTITYGSWEFEITGVDPSNGLNELSSTFRCSCGRYRTAGNF